MTPGLHSPLHARVVIYSGNSYMIETCSSARFPMALDYLNKNSSCTIDYSQQPRVFIVINLESHIYSMKPCTGPMISSDTLNKKAIHTRPCFCLCVHFQTVQSKVLVLNFLRLIPTRNQLRKETSWSSSSSLI